MAHLYKKIKNGREYYYIRETQRVYGKPTTINQVYLGTTEKMQAVFQNRAQVLEGFSPKEFGSIFVLNELDRPVDLAKIVNEILPAKKRSKGPSLGELLLYAALNRAIAPTSKRHLASWYETTDIQRIRPLRLGSLNSQNFWNHWDRLSASALEKITTVFFRKVKTLSSCPEEHLIMEAITISPTPRSPASPHPDTHRNRQKRVGLVLVSGASTGIPLYYKIYPGGVPQVGFYEKGVDDLLTKVSKVGATVKDITFIFPHGIDHQSAIKRLDSQERLRFIASEAPVLSPELANIPLKDYRPLPCKANQRLIAAGEEENQILYYETRLHSWGRSRRAIITFNPKTFQKKYQDLRTKVQKLRKEFLAVQKNYHPGEGKGEDLQAIRTHLGQFCHRLNLNPALFQVGFQEEGGLPAFQLDHAQVESTVRQFGKDILITDHEDWEAPEICRVYLERCVLEVNGNHGSRFNHDLDEARDSVQVSLMPLYHWTDSKIRIHVFACVVALTYLAMLNQRLTAGGLLISLKEAMEELRYLRSAIHVVGPEGKLKRILEKVTDTQLAILQALGFHVQEGNVAPF